MVLRHGKPALDAEALDLISRGVAAGDVCAPEPIDFESNPELGNPSDLTPESPEVGTAIAESVRHRTFHGMDAFAIANHMIAQAEQNGMPMDQMKLQKLLYFAHGWHLALTGTPLVDEPILAGPNGPLVGSVHDALVRMGTDDLRGIRLGRKGGFVTPDGIWVEGR
jgi:hypothetical protein